MEATSYLEIGKPADASYKADGSKVLLRGITLFKGKLKNQLSGQKLLTHEQPCATSVPRANKVLKIKMQLEFFLIDLRRLVIAGRRFLDSFALCET